MARQSRNEAKADEAYIAPNKYSVDLTYGPSVDNSNDKPCAMWLEPYRNMWLLLKKLKRGL